MSFQRSLYQTLCAFLQIKERKHIEQNFHSVAGVMPQGLGLGGAGGSKTLAWGFAMAPHRLRILVGNVSVVKRMNCNTNPLTITGILLNDTLKHVCT